MTVLDAVVCDMPYGHRHGNARINNAIYLKVIRDMVRVTAKGGRIVLLTTESKLMRRCLDDFKVREAVSHETTRPVNVSGFRAHVYILWRH